MNIEKETKLTLVGEYVSLFKTGMLKVFRIRKLEENVLSTDDESCILITVNFFVIIVILSFSKQFLLNHFLSIHIEK